MSESSNVALVTGGAGFIGSHIAEALLDRGYRVLVVDDLSSGDRDNIPADAAFHQLDIRSAAVSQLMTEQNVEVLYHLAAQIDLRGSVDDPRADAETNIIGLLNLLEAARRARVKQVVFASTGAIYGDPARLPADEQTPPAPPAPYAISKLTGERYLRFYHQQHGLHCSCLRYANVYGPRQNPHGEAGVIAIFADRLLRGLRPRIYGDGAQTRDYVFVDDVVEASLAVLGLRGFDIFNVGSGVETDVNTLFGLITSCLRGTPPAEYVPAKPGEQRRACLSSERIRARLDVRACTPIEEGIRRTVAWFQRRVTEHRAP